MARTTRLPHHSSDNPRASLAATLQALRPEIEQTALTRIYEVPASAEPRDAEYVQGLRAAVSAAVDYGISSVHADGGEPVEVPCALLAQARLAARRGVGLDAVQRRYISGYALLEEFLLGEVQQNRALDGLDLRTLKGSLNSQFQTLMDAVAEEYNREARSQPKSVEEVRVKLVEKILAGKFADHSELAHDLSLYHLGIVTEGAGALEGIRKLAQVSDLRLLFVRPVEERVWAWLSGKEPLHRAELTRSLASSWPERTLLALGEMSKGEAGWRRTHRQALEVFPLARHQPGFIARYADVALPTAMMKDELLTASLREMYLAPLDRNRSGEGLRKTLYAYFAANRNGDSAGQALGVSRQTVSNRLKTVEGLIGRPLSECTGDIEAALRLDAIMSCWKT